MAIDNCLLLGFSSHMSFTKELLAAIKRAHMERFGGNDSRMAEAANCDKTGLGRILKKEELPKFEALGRLADISGVKIIQVNEPYESEYAFIPKSKACLAAGGGSLETSDEVEGSLAFRRDWLNTKTKTKPNDLRAMHVFDDSMAPTFDGGDIVLVDESENARTLIEDRVYAIRWQGELFVKRFKKCPGELLFSGDNESRRYKDVHVKQGSEDDFAVIGRILWAGKEL